MAGGNSGGVESYLPIAAALAATIATDGAASPWLVEAMGTTAAGALTSGAAAAAASGLTAAVTGQDVGKAALMGGVSGGIGGALGAASAGTEGVVGAAGTESIAGAGGATAAGAPLTGGNIAGNAAVMGPSYAELGYTGAAAGSVPTGVGGAAIGPSYAELGYTPQMGPTNAELGYNATTQPGAIKAADAASSGGIGGWLANNKGLATMGGTAALGYLINQDNKKYGVPTDTTYEGPLSQFHYDPKKYTPLTTAQPSPAYKAQYPNYRANPYNPYAATGAQGGVVAMADGGIAMANPSIGPVEQMSRANAVGNNQMFPQAAINSPAFASATNRPMGQDMIAPTSDADVDPYTGAQRFAEGGTTEAKPQVGIPLQAMPNLITQNSVANNNALTQDLVSRMAARNAMNPVPGQTAPVVPAGIMAAAPYTAPTFNRPTNVAPINFASPIGVRGTAEWNTAEQARLAAEAEAANSGMFSNDTNRVMGEALAATGGLMQSYAAGGGVGHLGSYSDGGRLLKGPGDGMSDNIPASIGGKQPARLADSEFVVPADVVSHLGNGSTDAGAKKLYAMMDRVRKARTGTKKQGKQINADKFLPK
jgi:hypothetical protein